MRVMCRLIVGPPPGSKLRGRLSEFVSYRNNSIHAVLHLVCSLYSDINTKEVVMFWSLSSLMMTPSLPTQRQEKTDRWVRRWPSDVLLLNGK